MVNKNVPSNTNDLKSAHGLDYDVEEDLVTCDFYNRQNSNLLSDGCKKETFVKTGYKNWKKATEKFDKHQPPKTFKFPETVYGKQKRSFQHHWFEKYPWLDYDAEEDSVTCVFCKRQKSNLLLERCKKQTFLKTGYKNRKKAIEKFGKDQQSKCHKSALSYEMIVPQCRNALEMIDKDKKKNKKTAVN